MCFLLFLRIHSAPSYSSSSTQLPSLPPHPLIFLLFLRIHLSSFSSSPSTHLPSLLPHPLIFLLFLRIHSSSFSLIIGNLSSERNQIPSCSLQGTFCVKLGHHSIVDFYSVIITRLNTSSMK